MSEQATAAANEEGTTTEELSLLDQAVQATRQTERAEAEKLLKTFTEQALEGTITWDRNLGKTVESAINSLDEFMVLLQKK